MKTIKAVATSLFIFLILSISFSSCSDDKLINIPDTRQPFEIRAWDYSDNHYFLDSIYKESYKDFYNNLTISSHTDSFAVDEQTFEIWVQTDSLVISYRKAGLHIDLKKLPLNGVYDDSLRVVTSPEQGVRNFGLVRKLQPSEYKINRYGGFVSLKIDLPDNYFAGVAYKRPGTGEQFGTISTDSGSIVTDTLVLKMVKVQNLVPQNILAWNLKLRNIYQLPKKEISQTGFEFYLSYRSNNINLPTLPGVTTLLISMLGLDKYTSGRTGFPDNKFDFLPNLTIDVENGWIIFPSLKPFLTNLQYQFVEPEYWYPEIYSELKTNAIQYPNANKYVMHGYIP